MKTILIVDDEKDLVETLRLRLESAGDYRVNAAYNGEEALRAIEQSEPDLIVLDVMMPKMDGLTALKAINAKLSRKIPVIVMTGKTKFLKEAFELEGARAFLSKPVNGVEVASRVNQLLTS